MKVSDSEQKNRTDSSERLNLLWMWFFPIVPSRGTLAANCMGIAFFLQSLKAEIMAVCNTKRGISCNLLDF